MSQFIEMFGDPMVNNKQWPDYSGISEVTQIVLGSTPNSKEPSCWDGDIRWITPAEMTDQSYYIYDTVRHLTAKGRDAANLTMLPEGTVLFSTRAPIGKVAIVGKEMCCNQGFKNFICSEKLNNVFLYYTLKLKKDYLCSLGTGTTFKELSKRTVESLKIAVPPIELQNQFETIYNQADKSGFVGLKSQFIEMIELKNWPQMKLKDIVHEDCPISYGIVQPGDDMEDGVPIVRPIDMNDTHVINKKNLKHTSREISEAYNRTILRGDEILVCVRGTTGLIALADGLKGCNVTRGITPLFFKPQFNREYLYRAFLGQQVQDYIQDNTIGSTLKGINMSKLRELPICMPPKEVQEQFVVFARQADKSGYGYGFKLAS